MIKSSLNSLGLLCAGAILVLTNTAAAQGPSYDECGQLFQGVSCILFADGNGNE